MLLISRKQGFRRHFDVKVSHTLIGIFNGCDILRQLFRTINAAKQADNR